ncbi:hypothetical protein B0J17DRAFT_718036 [Rhizoctonia solani]|nr:hypothetical protein B0J17DRAFT_718036 [Rhizoctonia solani]
MRPPFLEPLQKYAIISTSTCRDLVCADAIVLSSLFCILLVHTHRQIPRAYLSAFPQAPPTTVAQSTNLPTFERMIPVEVMTHRYTPEIDTALPALD